MKIVIIGGVAGGASAAARLRRLSEDAEIVILERGHHVSFANCGMPYYIGNIISERKKLLVTPVERFWDRFRVETRIRNEVIQIDRVNKQLVVKDLKSEKTYNEPYDKLILSPGAAPSKPPIPGMEHSLVYTLRDLTDCDRIKEKLSKNESQRIAILGAGFIGLELAENILHLGLKLTIIQKMKSILNILDPEMTTPLTKHLKEKGAQIFFDSTISKIEDFSDRESKSGKQLKLALSDGTSVIADLLLVGIGVTPESQLASEAGLKIGSSGGISVNNQMQTSDSDIYAVGDAVETMNWVTGQSGVIPLAGPANRQGRIAANHIFGQKTSYRGTQGTAIVKICDWVAAITGTSESELNRRQIDYHKCYTHSAHHATYYPGAKLMTIKTLFSPLTRKVLGAQIIGQEGVDKKIDIFSIAIQMGMTVDQLGEVELAYAPQFGSAKDPVNMVGFVATGILDNTHPQITWEKVLELKKGTYLLLDVRTKEEFENDHIPDAMHIPVDELRNRINEVPNNRLLVTYCQVGQRGYIATRILLQKGFSVKNLSGGFKTFELYRSN